MGGVGPLRFPIAIGMMFILIYWLGSTNATFNFLAGNSTIAAKYCCASTSAYGATSWLLWIVFSPFALLLVVNYLSHRLREDGGEGDIHLEAAAEGDVGTVHEGPIGLFRQAFVNRRHHRHSLSDLARLGESEMEDDG